AKFNLKNGGKFEVARGGRVNIKNSIMETWDATIAGLVTVDGPSAKWTAMYPGNVLAPIIKVSVPGVLRLNGGEIQGHEIDLSKSNVQVDASQATLAGSGTVDGSVNSDGLVSVGSDTSTGRLAVTHDFTQSAFATLSGKIGGTAPDLP